MEQISTGINNETPEVGDWLSRARPASIQILRKICKVNRTIKFHINNLSIVLHSLNHRKRHPIKCCVIRFGTKVLVTDLLTLCLRSVVVLSILCCVVGTGFLTLFSPFISAWAAMSFSDSRDPNWYTDTGASARMTADAGNLKTNITHFFTLGPIRCWWGFKFMYFSYWWCHKILNLNSRPSWS